MSIKKYISIFVINYNGVSTLGSRLFKYLDTFAEEIKSFNDLADIWIIDNGSTDSSLEKIKERYGRLFNYLRLSKNFGYGVACNIAYTYLKKIGLEYKYYICSNNDIELFTNSLVRLVSTLKELETRYPRGFVATPLLINGFDGLIDYGCYFVDDAGNVWNLRLVFTNSTIATKVIKRPLAVHYADGAFLIVSGDVIENIGFFNSHMYLYYEDVELSLRAWSRGYPVLLLPIIMGKHYRSSTTKKLQFVAFVHTKNRIITMIEYMHPISLVKFLLWYIFYPLRLIETKSNHNLMLLSKIIAPVYNSMNLYSSIPYFFWGILRGLERIIERSERKKLSIFFRIKISDIISQKGVFRSLQEQIKKYILQMIRHSYALK